MSNPAGEAYEIAYGDGAAGRPRPSILKSVKPEKFLPAFRVLDAASGKPRWCAIVRQGLQSAIVAGLLAQHSSEESGDYAGFESIGSKARSAEAALELASHELAKPNPITAGGMSLSILQTRIGGAQTESTGDFPDGLAAAERDAAVLLKAIAILSDIALGAGKRRRQFSQPRLNPGLPEKVAFLKELAGVWRMLVGRRPSKSTDPSKNPFLPFVQAGWSDWKGEEATKDDPSFAAALRQFHKVV